MQDEASFSDLLDRCREVLDWHKTGFLTGDKLRALASTKHPHIEYGTRMKMAEDQTAREAMEFVIEFAERSLKGPTNAVGG